MSRFALGRKNDHFGFRVFPCDGHDFKAICAALDAAVDPAAERPAIVIASTVKGKGVDFMEDRPEWHYGSIDTDMFARSLASVREDHSRRTKAIGG